MMRELKKRIISDFYRRDCKTIRQMFFGFFAEESLRYLLYLRSTQYFEKKNIIMFQLFKYLYKGLGKKYGVIIPYQTKIGYGLYLGYFHGIFINGNTVIGNNCNISHQVTLAKDNRKKGAPILGSNVYIGPGAKIVGGNAILKNNVAVGANSVVTKEVKGNFTVAGVPAREINNLGSKEYINNRYEVSE